MSTSALNSFQTITYFVLYFGMNYLFFTLNIKEQNSGFLSFSSFFYIFFFIFPLVFSFFAVRLFILLFIFHFSSPFFLPSFFFSFFYFILLYLHLVIFFPFSSSSIICTFSASPLFHLFFFLFLSFLFVLFDFIHNFPYFFEFYFADTTNRKNRQLLLSLEVSLNRNTSNSHYDSFDN